MKKIFSTHYLVFLLAALFTVSCQKEMKPLKEEATSLNEESADPANAQKDREEGECRLVSNDWPTVANWQFHYNHKGLADQWTIDYGSGLPLHTNAMTYDRNNRLVESIENFFGSVYEYRFYYNDDRLTRLTRTNVNFPDDALDFAYTYNRKGENIRQDDDIHDQHVHMYYDALGNCTKTDVYLGTDLWYSDNYTFNAPVKNPRKNIPGVETGFPFYGTGGLKDKRWFTSNRTLIYAADGTPFVYNDYDPSRTVIRTDNHNLPVSAGYYDRVTESWLTITFGYDNCGRSNGNDHDGGDYGDDHRTSTSSPAKSASPDNIKNQVGRILHGPVKDMKEQISALRKQLRK